MRAIVKSKVIDVPFENQNGQFYYLGAIETLFNGNLNVHYIVSPFLLIDLKKPPLVRLNSACLSSDLFGGSIDCDCNWQLNFSLKLINQSKNGLLIYSTMETGRGFGPVRHLREQKLKKFLDPAKEQMAKKGIFLSDKRTYLEQVAILRELGLFDIDLITNNPKKIDALRQNGINVRDRIPIQAPASGGLKGYFEFKRDALGHFF